MSFTSDPNDPDLKRGVDEQKTSQHKKYLVLSEEERAKGFVRPVRLQYVHVGNQKPICGKKFAESPDGIFICNSAPHDGKCTHGKLFGTEDLKRLEEGKYLSGNKGCGVVTKMAEPLAETYARNPGFYGATYCVGCEMHLPVGEFVWSGTEERVGS